MVSWFVIKHRGESDVLREDTELRYSKKICNNNTQHNLKVFNFSYVIARNISVNSD